MGSLISSQTTVFLYSMMFGIILGVIYDVFRITRIAFNLGRVIIAFEDILYCCICAVITFFYMLTTIDGQVRFFIIIGEVIGFIIYYFTLGEVVMSISSFIINFIKRTIIFLFKLFIMPIIRLIRKIFTIFTVPIKKSSKIFKKIKRNTKFRLKNVSILLYNLIKGINNKNDKKQIDRWEENTYDQKDQV